MSFITVMPAPPEKYMQSFLEDMRKDSAKKADKAAKKAASANTFKIFWMTHHNLRRHPFAPPGTPVTRRGSSGVKSAWASLKGFFKTHHKLRRHPFDIKV